MVSLIMGVIALITGLVPCVGHNIAYPLGGVGFIIGLLAMLLVGVQKEKSIALPLAGLLLNMAAIAAATAWLAYMSSVLDKLQKR